MFSFPTCILPFSSLFYFLYFYALCSLVLILKHMMQPDFITNISKQPLEAVYIMKTSKLGLPFFLASIYYYYLFHVHKPEITNASRSIIKDLQEWLPSRWPLWSIKGWTVSTIQAAARPLQIKLPIILLYSGYGSFPPLRGRIWSLILWVLIQKDDACEKHH